MEDMKYFGNPEGFHPWKGHLKQVATPVGITCGWCREKIKENDSGFVMKTRNFQFVMHEACLAREHLGSISRQKKRLADVREELKFPVEPDRDPEGMTSREAAEAALTFWVANGRRVLDIDAPWEIWSKKACPECDGKGEISGKTCPSCFGDGVVWESRVDEAKYKRSTGRIWKPVKEK
jgi:hypothetical protein